MLRMCCVGRHGAAVSMRCWDYMPGLGLAAGTWTPATDDGGESGDAVAGRQSRLRIGRSDVRGRGRLRRSCITYHHQSRPGRIKRSYISALVRTSVRTRTVTVLYSHAATGGHESHQVLRSVSCSLPPWLRILMRVLPGHGESRKTRARKRFKRSRSTAFGPIINSGGGIKRP